MTGLREAAQMALDALEHGLPIIEDFGGKEQLQLQHKAIAVLYEALRAALAQPPCATGSQCVGNKCECCVVQEHEWQGLTDEDYEAMAEKYVTNCYFDTLKYARAIEARLREKNS